MTLKTRSKTANRNILLTLFPVLSGYKLIRFKIACMVVFMNIKLKLLKFKSFNGGTFTTSSNILRLNNVFACVFHTCLRQTILESPFLLSERAQRFFECSVHYFFIVGLYEKSLFSCVKRIFSVLSFSQSKERNY